MVKSCDTRMPTTRAICGSSTPARIMAPSRVRSSMSQSAIANTTAMSDDRQTIERRRRGADADEAAKPRRRRHRDRIAAPGHQAKIGDHEGDAERHQHLRQLLAGEPTQQQPLHQRAEHRHFEARAMSAATQKFSVKPSAPEKNVAPR